VYKFSRVFQQDAGQADVYEGTTAALVRAATASNGHNGSGGGDRSSMQQL